MKNIYKILFLLFSILFISMTFFCLSQEPLEVDYYTLLSSGFSMITFAVLWRTHGR